MVAPLCLLWTIWKERNEIGGYGAFNPKDEELFDVCSMVVGNSQFKCAGHECNKFFGSFSHYVGVGLVCFFLFSSLFSLLVPLYTPCILSGLSLFL